MSAASTQARGLGKGLSALLSETYSQTPVAPKAGQEGSDGKPATPMLAVDKLKASKYQPRTGFDAEALQELADSIKKNGLMQPILVREASKGQYEIVAGERRWRAAKLAGLTQVPVILREINDQQALELAIVENVQRQDLNPLEEANAYQRLMDEFAYKQEDISTNVGKSRSHVANLLRLLTLPEPVKEMIGAGSLTAGHARALLNASNPQALADEIVKRGLNVRQAEDLSRGNLVIGGNGEGEARKPSANGKGKDEDILALEQTLSDALGLKVRINDRGQSGDIVMSYNSLSELDEILRRLGGSV